MLVCILTTALSAQVVIKESVDPINQAKIVTLGVVGNPPYSSIGTPPMLALQCMSLDGKHHRVALLLNTGAVLDRTPIEKAFGVGHESPHSLEGAMSKLIDGGTVRSVARFAEDKGPRQLMWMPTENSSTLSISSFKIIRDKFLRSKQVHIQITVFNEGSKTSSFDLTGLAEAYATQPGCKQR